MAKTLCKDKDREKAEKKEGNPKFECKRCGRKARKEKYLCKPEKD